METIKKYGIILLSTIVLCLQSCLKVDEEKFFSVYTGEAVITENGVTLTARINKESLNQNGQYGFLISIDGVVMTIYLEELLGKNKDSMSLSLPWLFTGEDYASTYDNSYYSEYFDPSDKLYALWGKTLEFCAFYSDQYGRDKYVNLPTHVSTDLGLSVNWANCNIGDSLWYTEYNDYFYSIQKKCGFKFAWGDNLGYVDRNIYDFHWDNYKWCEYYNSQNYSITKYSYEDQKYTLDKEDDAATKNIGSDWRMPTEEEFQELIDKCSWTKIRLKLNFYHSDSYIDGYKVEGDNGNCIFLPEGEYWSSSREYYNSAYCLKISPLNYSYITEEDDEYIYELTSDERCLGKFIRAVRED